MSRRIEMQTIRGQVYDQMREMILDGVWEPGSRIDLNQMVVEFGVSKTPLNEAIQKLLQEGLLFVKPRSGTFVSDLNVEEMGMTFDFRLALEVGSANAIVANTTPADIEKLETIDAKMSDILDGKGLSSRKEFLRLDAEFHDKIITACGNRLVVEHYRQVNSLSIVSRARGKFTKDEYRAAIVDHAEIIGALKANDVEAFHATCQTHIANAKRKLEVALQRANEE